MANPTGYRRKMFSFSQHKHWLAHPSILVIVTLFFVTISHFIANFVINFVALFLSPTGSILAKADQFSLDFFLKTHWEMLMFYIPFYILGLVFGLKKVYQFRMKFKSLDYGEKGTNRWATKKEIKKQYKAIPIKDEVFEGEGGLPVAMFGSKENEKAYIDESAVNNLFIGTTRSGKGEIYVLPMIDNYSRSTHQPSLTVNDTKGELFSASKPTLEGRGYHVEVFNLLNPDESSMSFNLLQLVIDEYMKGDKGEAQEMTKQISFILTSNTDEKSEWNEMAGDLINAMILALCKECLPDNPEKVTLYSVANMIQSLSSQTLKEEVEVGNQIVIEEVNGLDKYMSTFPPYDPAKMQYATVEAAPDKMRSSIIGMALKALAPFTTENIAKMTSHTSMDVNKLGFPNIIDGFHDKDSDFDISIFRFNESKNDYEHIEGISISSNQYGYWQYPFENKVQEKDIFIFSKEDSHKEIQKLEVEITDKDDKGNVTYQYLNNKPDILKDIDIRKFNSFDKPIALFMVVPDYNSANHGIASILTNQIIFQLSKNAQMYTVGQSTYRKVIFHLDEAGNMPVIPELSKKVNVSLSRGLRFNLFVQAFAQIKSLYEKDYEAIMDSMGNKIYIMATNADTPKDFSQMLGNEQITVRSRSGESGSMKSSITENQEERPLLTADELTRLKEGETVVVRNIKRQDTERNKTIPYPIFNNGKDAMKYRYQYLSDSMNTSQKMIHFSDELKKECEHRNIRLETTIVDWQKVLEEIQGGSIEAEQRQNNKQNKKEINHVKSYKEKKDEQSKNVTITKKSPKLRHLLGEEVFEQVLTRLRKTMPQYFDIKTKNQPEKLTEKSLEYLLKEAMIEEQLSEKQHKAHMDYIVNKLEEAKVT